MITVGKRNSQLRLVTNTIIEYKRGVGLFMAVKATLLPVDFSCSGVVIATACNCLANVGPILGNVVSNATKFRSFRFIIIV